MGVQRYIGGDTSDGIVANLALKLEIRSTAMLSRGWNTNLRQDFVRAQCRLEGRVGKELVDGDDALAVWARRYDLRSQRQHGRGMIVGGISVGKVAANGGPVAHDG